MAWGLIPFLFVPVPIPVGRVSKSSAQEGTETLVIYMTFVPTKEGFMFHPGGLAVTPDEGSAHSTVEFIGPVDASCAGVWVKAETSQGYPLRPQQKTCFVMRFPPQASPETGFRLSFSGLSIHGDPVSPLDLSYAKFSGNPEE